MCETLLHKMYKIGVHSGSPVPALTCRAVELKLKCDNFKILPGLEISLSRFLNAAPLLLTTPSGDVYELQKQHV